MAYNETLCAGKIQRLMKNIAIRAGFEPAT